MGRRISADVLADACSGSLRVAGSAAGHAGEDVAGPVKRKHSDAAKQSMSAQHIRNHCGYHLNDCQLAVYRLYRSKKYTMAEALAACLGASK